MTVVAVGVLLAACALAPPRAVARPFARPAPVADRPSRRWRRAPGADRAAFALVLELIARELRSGATVPVALRRVAVAEPAAVSLLGVVDRIDRGGRVGAELDRWADQVGTADADLARAVLRLGITTGAALADSLDRVASTVRDRLEMDDELRALTAQSRASATVLAVAPVGFLVVLTGVDPGLVVPLVAGPVGWACLGGGLALDLLGFWWMRRLVAGAVG